MAGVCNGRLRVRVRARLVTRADGSCAAGRWRWRTVREVEHASNERSMGFRHAMTPPSRLDDATPPGLTASPWLLPSLSLGALLLLWRRRDRRLRRVVVIAPGSGAATRALAHAARVYLAVDPAYDRRGLRYPPGWSSMHGVALDEQTAARQGIDVVQQGFGRASACNLATWASVLFNATDRTLKCVDLSMLTSSSRGAACADALDSTDDERTAAQLVRARAVRSLDCLVCGSRGGQVTLLALWQLGLRLPAVVINGGCAREGVGWTWPSGVPVVLLTAGLDFFNEHRDRFDGDGDAIYVRELWDAVPPESRATTAIVHLPGSEHHLQEETLRAMLPQLVAYAQSGLAAEATPTAAGLGVSESCLLVTAAFPSGIWLRAPSPAAQHAAPATPPAKVQLDEPSEWAREIADWAARSPLSGALQACLNGSSRNPM